MAASVTGAVAPKLEQADLSVQSGVEKIGTHMYNLIPPILATDDCRCS